MVVQPRMNIEFASKDTVGKKIKRHLKNLKTKFSEMKTVPKIILEAICGIAALSVLAFGGLLIYGKHHENEN